MANRAERAGERDDPRPFARAPFALHGFLSVATLNLGHGSAAAVKQSLNRARDMGFLVIGCQEGGDRELVLKEWCRVSGYVYFPGDGSPGAASTPILYARTLKVTGRGTKFGSAAQNWGDHGAGDATGKRKVINYIKIVGGWTITNSHLVPSASYAKNRRPAYIEYMDNLMEFLRDQRGYVVAVGDYNAQPNFFLLARMRKWGNQISWGSTHDHYKQPIDHIWINPKVIPISVWKAEIRSDHDLVGALVAKKPAFKRAA